MSFLNRFAIFYLSALFIFLPHPLLLSGEIVETQTDVLLISEKDLLQSIREHHPLIESALQKVESQKAALLGANGAFDPVLSAKGMLQTGGYYELRTLETEITQPTPFWGIEGWVGYRLGIGNDDENRFPTYYENETLSQGEVSGGLRIPLWRDGLTDVRRTRQTTAEFGIESARQAYQMKILELESKGIVTFWKWTSQSQKVNIAQLQLELLLKRQKQLESQNQLGSISEISLMENERAIAFQENLLLQYQQALQKSRIDLSLFLRKQTGEPIATEQPLKVQETPLREVPLLDGESFISCQPSIREILAEIRSLEAELRLANNQLAPKALVELEASRDFGSEARNSTLSGTVFEAKASIEVPLLFRKERGKAREIEAKLKAKAAELKWMQDQVQNQIQELNNQLSFASKRYKKTKELFLKAQKLSEAERVLFQSGASDLLRVNIREQFEVKTQIDQVEAFNETLAIEGVVLRWKKLNCDQN